jgi:hypothetical protein
MDILYSSKLYGGRGNNQVTAYSTDVYLCYKSFYATNSVPTPFKPIARYQQCVNPLSATFYGKQPIIFYNHSPKEWINIPRPPFLL